MKRLLTQKYWHQLFQYSLFVKGFLGFWEIILGSILLYTSGPFAQLIPQQFSSGIKLFVGFYVLTHGILNVFLAIQLYRNKYWAYVVAIITMIVLVLYQIYRIGAHHSIVLVMVTLFDILFIALTWHEYLYQKKSIL